MDLVSDWEPDGSPESGAACVDQTQTDRVTVLRTFGPLATKRVIRTADGSVDYVDYDPAKHFRVTEHSVSDLLSLAALLDATSQCKRSVIVRGEPIPGINRNRATRTLRDKIDPETGEVLETATLKSVPRRWLLLDIDDVPCAPDIDIFDADVVVPYVASLLPTQFHAVSCRWSFTSGHGIKSGIRVRLAYWLSRPLITDEFKAWLGERFWDESTTTPTLRKRWPVDLSVFGANQPNYIAPPVFEDGIVDPVPVRSGLWRGDTDEVTPPHIDLTKPTLPLYTGDAPLPCGGYDAYRALIGVDEMHAPIWSAVCSYFRRNGAGVDAQWLRDDLESVIRERGRDIAHITKHLSKLDGMIARARASEADREARYLTPPDHIDETRDSRTEMEREDADMPYDFNQTIQDLKNVEIGDAYEVRDQEPKRTIKAVPIGRFSEIKVPPRQFALGKRLQYGEVTLGASPGGVGKTSLAMLEAIAWIMDRTLTGEFIRPRGNAWIITAEESIEEMQRRILATCMHFKIDPDELYGRLFITSTKDGGSFKVIEVERGGKLVDTQAPDDVIAEIRENNIGYLGVDPFITTHECDEADNVAMDRVTRVFCRIARTTNVVVSLLHHVVKSDDPEAHAGNLARVRGAGGIINAARHAYTIANINEETKEKYGLSDDEAVRIMRMDVGLKGNYVLKPTEPMWFWRESVNLNNAVYDADGSELWEADEVGVLRPFSMSNLVYERHRIAEAAKEPERDKLAQLVADKMSDDRMSMNTFVKEALKNNTFERCADTKLREMLKDAIPMLHEGYRNVRVLGRAGRIWMRRVAEHDRAGIEIIREAID
jgi:hypothetical protein